MGVAKVWAWPGPERGRGVLTMCCCTDADIAWETPDTLAAAWWPAAEGDDRTWSRRWRAATATAGSASWSTAFV